MTQPGPSGTGSVDNSELESFRKQWREEVKAKGGPAVARGESAAGPSSASAAAPVQAPVAPTPAPAPAPAPARDRHRQPPQHASAPQQAVGVRRGISNAPQTTAKLLSAGKKLLASEFDDDYAQPRAFDELVDEYGRVLSRPAASTAHATDDSSAALEPEAKTEPQSALEHYEKAVEKEELGSLGDSLKHYRTAFRMDSAVDKKYRNKHFPAPAAPPAGKQTTTDTAATDEGAAVVPAKPVRKGPPPTLKELIMSFAGLGIEAAPPPVEGMPEPPCPLADLPDEILVHILRDVAMDDVGDFVRLAQVCRKLAFLVATEDGIWGHVCVGAKFGFASMHRSWQRSVSWEEVTDDGGGGGGGGGGGEEDDTDTQRLATTMTLRKGSATSPAVFPSWQRMFRLRPRIRFNGCYISTVNYIRAGQPSATLATWSNSPVHIVTYFRYLRFFRDGTVISLLTTAEPTDVIHFMTKTHLLQHQGNAMPHLPSAVMQNAHRGRWRISGGGGAAEGELPTTLAAAIEAESDLVVETEGVGKYYYRMELGFRTAGKGTRNNKLNWRGFYSYDRLTDDWGEFGLKNYRPFFFSRVRSYGMGE